MDTTAATAEAARRAEIDRIVGATNQPRVEPSGRNSTTVRRASLRSRLLGVVRELVEDGIDDAVSGF